MHTYNRDTRPYRKSDYSVCAWLDLFFFLLCGTFFLYGEVLKEIKVSYPL